MSGAEGLGRRAWYRTPIVAAAIAFPATVLGATTTALAAPPPVPPTTTTTATTATTTTTTTAPPPAAATTAEPAAGTSLERPFELVLEQVVEGDLVMAGNSNLLSAGGWRLAEVTAADVDGDTTELCVPRLPLRTVCSDNSSSAELAIPSGARVLHARLYVATSLGRDVIQVGARLAGPGAPGYTDLGPTTAGIPRLYEAVGDGPRGSLLRQAVWDVTDYVAAQGPGTYTVADIVNRRAGPWLPYASWAIVAAYERDPAADPAAPPADPQRFARRAVSWHDGFVVGADAAPVTVGGFEMPVTHPPFAKTFHLVAHGERASFDNLLLDGHPLGNNLSPGDEPPPVGTTIGDDPACNSTVDVFNDSICVLGAPVATKSPGAADYVAASDGATESSGSGVDMDVLRVPDRYLVAGATSAELAVLAAPDGTAAAGMLAFSLDLDPSSRVSPAPTADPVVPVEVAP